MQNHTEVSVFGVVGNPLCVAADDGQKVYERIARMLKDERTVTLSFHNVEGLTSAFLNTAIGQLYGHFNEDYIRNHLKVEDIEPDDAILLKRVVDTAKAYFRDPQRFNQITREILEEVE